MWRLLISATCLGVATLLVSCASYTSRATDSPDFSLSTSPGSAAIQAGGASVQVSVMAVAVNSFSGTVAVAVSGLPAGVTATPASLHLSAGQPQSVTLAASSSAAAASATITFTGTNGSLTHSASLALSVTAAAPQPQPPPVNAPDVTTFHYDNARDGLNAQETKLRLGNVNSTQFGKLGFDTVDGLVDAEPLFLANLNAGGTVRNVIFVATEHASVYAFDADTGAQIWKTSVLGTDETTSDSRGCGQVVPEIGIVETPVIDRSQGPNGTIFVVAMSKDGSGNYHQRLHALDVATGAEIAGSPTEITATFPGKGANSSNGNVVFDPGQYKERAALLLVNGTLYIAFSSHCDIGPYTGWVMAYGESTLKQTQVLNLTPNGTDGSIWMSGDGIAADSGGNLFLLDANGTFDTMPDANGFPAGGDYGNAILKLTTSGKLAVADYFEAYNTVAESNADQDLGSGGEVLLPDQTDAQGKTRHLIVGGGKDNNLYVADRDDLGKFSPVGNENVYQELVGVGAMFSTPAAFNGVLYVGAVGSPLRAFPITNAKLASTPSSQTAVSFGYPGTSPGISANGTQNGIVWAVESSTGSAAVLHAYDAADLTHELYNSQQAANGRDSFGNGNKFITPLVVNGKVYVGTPTGVAVFGLLQ
jgi:PQQ enzyme repeat